MFTQDEPQIKTKNIMSIQIQPQNKTQTITSFNIDGVVIIPFTRAIISLSFYASDETFISRSSLTMSSEDYLLWKSDDQFLVDWLVNKLGYNKLKIE